MFKGITPGVNNATNIKSVSTSEVIVLFTVNFVPRDTGIFSSLLTMIFILLLFSSVFFNGGSLTHASRVSLLVRFNELLVPQLI